MMRKLTYYRVYWNNGCVDEYLPDKYYSIMEYKDMKKYVSVVQKIRKVVNANHRAKS